MAGALIIADHGGEEEQRTSAYRKAIQAHSRKDMFRSHDIDGQREIGCVTKLG